MPRTDLDPTIPTERDAEMARVASRLIAERETADGDVRLQLVAAGRELTALELPASVAKLLKAMLKEVAAGHAVSVVPMDAEITTQQAADLLSVSRPYVVGLVDKGVLPARMVGPQRRVPLKDVLAYRAASKAKGRAALKEMVGIAQELGLE